MKIIYWGKDEKMVESAYGPSPIEPNSRADLICDMIKDTYDVRVVLTKDKVKCPKCGSINEFDVVRSFNFGVESVTCLGCEELLYGPGGDEVSMSQRDWDTIILDLCP